MVPLSLLRYDVRDREVTPVWLGPHDHGWLRGLLDEYERFVGRPRWELRRRLSEPLPVEGSSWRIDVARDVLDGLWPLEVGGQVRPRVARAMLFDEAARGLVGTRDELIARVAGGLGIEPDVLREALFADLPGQRRLAALEPPISPLELELRSNLAIAQSILFRASAVRIELAGRARDVVRYAKLRGLVCTVLPGDDHDAAVLEISGPLALFRRTLAYGRALASVLPRLSWCHRFVLRADCLLDELPRTLVLRSGDPIFPASEPIAFDSRLEKRFARELAAAAPDWDVIREPEAVPAAGTLIFPDFAVQHRIRPERRWLIEIAGFWTPDYLVGKLRRLREARLENLILCIDEERNCAAEDLPAGARVVRYRKRVHPTAILAILEERQPSLHPMARRSETMLP
ncbi:MAG: DUF790 family protein [Deltaproteobacteria bacterium]|nr:DUF790 family protein [Deltaproteobacteria bacterium]